MPREATPVLIGAVVTIQIFELEAGAGSEIMPNTLVKVVGTLQAYGWHEREKRFAFNLVGDRAISTYSLNEYHIEIFPHRIGK